MLDDDGANRKSAFSESFTRKFEVRMKEEAKDKRSSVESEIKDDLEKVSDEVVDCLDKHYPISMNLLRNIFGRGAKR